MAKCPHHSEESPLCKHTFDKNGQVLRYVISADENKKMTPEARREVLCDFWGEAILLVPGLEDWGQIGTKTRLCKMIWCLSARRDSEKNLDRKQQWGEDVCYLEKLLSATLWDGDVRKQKKPLWDSP